MPTFGFSNSILPGFILADPCPCYESLVSYSRHKASCWVIPACLLYRPLFHPAFAFHFIALLGGFSPAPASGESNRWHLVPLIDKHYGMVMLSKKKIQFESPDDKMDSSSLSLMVEPAYASSKNEVSQNKNIKFEGFNKSGPSNQMGASYWCVICPGRFTARVFVGYCVFYAISVLDVYIYFLCLFVYLSVCRHCTKCR